MTSARIAGFPALRRALGASAALVFGALLAGDARAAATPDECIRDVSPTPVGKARVVRCQGGSVDFSLTIPEVCSTNGGCGLIVDAPGFSVSADNVDENTGLREAARNLPNPFIVINPARPIAGGVGGAQFNNFDLRENGGSADEVFAFMQRAATVFQADRNRIHIGGFSQGGLLTFSFLCDPEKAAFIASAAPHAAAGRGAGSCFGTGPNATNPNVPVLFFTGRKDMLAPPAQQFAIADGIIAGLKLQDQGVIDSGANGFEQRRFTGPEGAILETIRWDNTGSPVMGVPVGGHCYVGAVTPDAFSCAGPAGFQHGQKLLEFYMAHPKAAAPAANAAR